NCWFHIWRRRRWRSRWPVSLPMEHHYGIVALMVVTFAMDCHWWRHDQGDGETTDQQTTEGPSPWPSRCPV
ncbi:hypothetical protein HAX54_015334, partial [Datura stramonium]|nr:hypothetical protein [Datura stramonium]